MRGFPATRRTFLSSAVGAGVGLLGGCSEALTASRQNRVSSRWTATIDADIYYFVVTSDWIFLIRRYCENQAKSPCPSVSAFDRDTGKRQWAFEAPELLLALGGTDIGVFAVGLTTLYRLTPTAGNVEWRYPMGEMAGTSLAPAMTSETVCVRTRDEVLHAVDAKTGDRRWAEGLSNPKGSPPTVAGDTVYLTTFESTASAFAAETGERRWTFDTSEINSYPPLVADGTVYVSGDRLYAIDGKTGKERWAVGDPDHGFLHLLVVDDTVYTLGGNDLYAVDARTGEQRWRTDAFRDNSINHVTADDGALYVVTRSAVAKLDSETGVVEWWSEEIRRTESDTISVQYATLFDETFYFATFNNRIYAITLEALQKAKRTG